jgi:hypothetical protein
VSQLSEQISGLVLVSKRDCPTCTLIAPVMSALDAAPGDFLVVSQDDPTFPEGVSQIIDDTSLEASFRLDVEIVPTLIRFEGGREVARIFGWDRSEWRAFTGLDTLGEDLPATRPGCGSRTTEPGIAEELAARFGAESMHARRIGLGTSEDDSEACFERGWSDGLPVVPPTEARVYRMLQGTRRSPAEVLGAIPPNLAPCSIEKVAINAVMAGCRPEYLPVVIAAVEAALDDAFCMHGLLCTTWFASPIVIVNGPLTREIGMNSGINALGQGNRANATIGRALQLVIRNVGGGRPGEIDRSALGHPGKYTFCFAEDESDTRWTTLGETYGFEREQSTVTLFGGDGVQGILDQKSRTPESLARTFAAFLRNVCHPKLVQSSDALLVVSPEHARVFHEADWSKEQLLQELHSLLQLDGHELVTGSQGITEGLPPSMRNKQIAKFRSGGINIVRAGGKAGMFSALIGGWPATGEMGSSPVTRRIES